MNRIIICVALAFCCYSLDLAASSKLPKREVPAELRGLRKDLNKLNKWFAEKTGSYNSYKEAINEKLLTSINWNPIGGDPKRAGQYYIKVSEMASAGECTDETLEMLRQLNGVIKREFSKHRDADYMLGVYAKKMALNCQPKISGKFDELIKQFESEQFVRQLQPVNLDVIGKEAYKFDDQDLELLVTTGVWEKLVRTMAGSDPRNVYAHVTRDSSGHEFKTVTFRENFDQVVEEYVVKPCNQFETTALKKLVETIVAIGYFTRGGELTSQTYGVNKPYFEGLPVEIQNYLHRFYFCRTVLGKKLRRDDVFDFLSHTDSSKETVELLREADKKAKENGNI